MPIDPLDAQLAELDQACKALNERLDALRQATSAIRRMRERGKSPSEIVRIGPGVRARRETREAWSRVNQALYVYRVRLVRSLIDDEGLSIMDAARLTGNARQVVSRLYHSEVR